ncbi:MAG: DUF4249 domain-containing protein [Bacteroidota bacterium]|nr:DUF4249 domain-containing protein [Bacteroidota bacterium]MDP4217218.1 DUF4249 domain-containing protein [Bacteroidota bacterium]MDP4247063.1 DUF4249 domain-containing protein [Bacteroidota bacterium]MDP4254562.1 DUF4249 domain-containing protein [Bacteroidota bacterium]MDP4257363.1 DUF4249 domain-containing protein [Bacteroidota bacterium]
MRRLSTLTKIVILFITLSVACKEAYVPPIISSNNRYLVVEGFINNGADSTQFHLTRSYKLDDSASLQPELHAILNIEGKDNSSYPLVELGSGYYACPGLALNNAIKYRLHIRTSDGKQYLSDFVELKTSPPIDSISWVRNNDGLQIYCNAHDDQGTSRYYRFQYDETWQFNAVFYSGLEYVHDSLRNRAVNNMFTCWKTVSSTNILLASTAKLSKDVVQFPVVLVPSNSWMISIKYSIIVRQYVLTPDAYDFWSNLQKNSEQIGSLFSPEPFQSRGNIHSVSDSNELVIGYVSAGTMRQQRIFLTPYDIPNWIYGTYEDGCHLISIKNDPDTLQQYLSGFGYLPVDYDPTSGGGKPRVEVTFTVCADCTQIGSNTKPYFWP